ncbi:MAG TPA: AI-2E family transporter [Candidatus Limnocylindrales bacterium]|jgi:predicted PurR-regulated permease PerM
MTRSSAEPRAAASPLGGIAGRWRLLVLGVAVLAVLWLARGIVGPFVVAAVLAYAFSPVVTAAQVRTGLPRALVIGIGYVVVLGALAVLALVAANRIDAELRELSAGGNDIIGSALHKLFGDSVDIAGQQIRMDDLAAEIKRSIHGVSPSDALQMVVQAVDVALQAVLALIVTFYFLLDGRRFGEFALRFLDRSQRADALRISHRIHVVLGRWIRGQLLLIGLVAAVLYLILGPVLHVPYALILGILSGFLEIVPLLGPLIAATIAGTVAFSTRGTDTTIAVLAVYIVLRQLEDQVVMPLVIGRAVHLHPVVTIFAVLVGLSAWGVLGGLLAVPVAAALNVTLHELFPEETAIARDEAGPRDDGNEAGGIEAGGDAGGPGAREARSSTGPGPELTSSDEFETGAPPHPSTPS